MRTEFNAEEYYSKTPVITYKKIIDLLADQTVQKIIVFASDKDYKTGKTYQIVRVRYFNPERHELYMAPSQDVDVINSDLHSVLGKSELNPSYHALYNYVCSYIALVGRNYVDFPREVARQKYVEEVNKAREESKARCRNADQTISE
jgi:hypothetical protein